MKKTLLILLALIVIAVAVFFALNKKDTKNTEIGTIAGNLTYLDRMALDPNSMIVITVQDVSKMDAPAETISETTFYTEGKQVPIPFNINYDKSKIIENHTYTISAKVFSGDELVRITDTAYPVITNNANTENLELILKIVNQEENTINATSSTNTDNTNTQNNTNNTKSLENKNISLNGKTFNLVSVNDKKIENVDGRYFLSFEGDKIHGKFCNVLNGNYTLENNVLKSMMISTMMYCQTPEGLMDAESTLSKILAEGGKVLISGKTLSITHDNYKIVFEAK